eukprot:TRINITY_DN248_c0_g1_i12.p1 TRINITY_DN248_c0_g1~~TRINITY_DN248_c0_g1_i12.p1  ORF type:complete len:549 (-),score=42.23 TRINITY_DN248_c0_g1_i12:226-1872(-)
MSCRVANGNEEVSRTVNWPPSSRYTGQEVSKGRMTLLRSGYPVPNGRSGRSLLSKYNVLFTLFFAFISREIFLSRLSGFFAISTFSPLFPESRSFVAAWCFGAAVDVLKIRGLSLTGFGLTKGVFKLISPSFFFFKFPSEAAAMERSSQLRESVSKKRKAQRATRSNSRASKTNDEESPTSKRESPQALVDLCPNVPITAGEKKKIEEMRAKIQAPDLEDEEHIISEEVLAALAIDLDNVFADSEVSTPCWYPSSFSFVVAADAIAAHLSSLGYSPTQLFSVTTHPQGPDPDEAGVSRLIVEFPDKKHKEEFEMTSRLQLSKDGRTGWMDLGFHAKSRPPWLNRITAPPFVLIRSVPPSSIITPDQVAGMLHLYLAEKPVLTKLKHTSNGMARNCLVGIVKARPDDLSFDKLPGVITIPNKLNPSMPFRLRICCNKIRCKLCNTEGHHHTSHDLFGMRYDNKSPPTPHGTSIPLTGDQLPPTEFIQKLLQDPLIKLVKSGTCMEGWRCKGSRCKELKQKDAPELREKGFQAAYNHMRNPLHLLSLCDV